MTDAVRLPDPPPVPARLPCGLTDEQVRAWAASVSCLDDAGQLASSSDEIDAAEALLVYLRSMRERQAARWYLSGAKVREIGKAARIADSLVSRLMSKLGMPARRPDRARPRKGDASRLPVPRSRPAGAAERVQ